MSGTTPTSFFTFGMFIIDEIEFYEKYKKPKTNLIGGAGTYAALGARLLIACSPSQRLSRSVSWIVDMGSDFPIEIKNTIETWNTQCIFRDDPKRLTTRAWNGYGDKDFREFKYTTPKIRLEVTDLTAAQALSKSFHMVCSPDRCIDLIDKLEAERMLLYPMARPPLIVWEPIPDLCTPEQRSRMHKASLRCFIVSPNREELKSFFSKDVADERTQLELVKMLMCWKDGLHDRRAAPIPVIREGVDGSTAYLRHPINKQICQIHVPAYYTPDKSHLVVDPTGGGNTYLGALALALTDALWSQQTYQDIVRYLGMEVELRNLDEHLIDVERLKDHDLVHLPFQITAAMICATVAASFAIQQHGVPELNPSNFSTATHEKWNEVKFCDRVKSYLEREGESITMEVRIASQMFDSASKVLQ